MSLNIDQAWVLQNKELLLKILEADFDPHLKRINPNSLEFKTQSFNEDGSSIIELHTIVLEYGGCSGVSHETPELRRLKVSENTESLGQSLIPLL